MSFPGSFSSQLTAIMEALLKAVVTEVTALVEDGAVELRLELRDRDRQILDKEREVEERDQEIGEKDRVIEELRAAVEELMAREEAAVRSVEEEKDGREQTESCEQQEWSKEEEDTKLVVKSEPTEEFASASTDPHVSLWPPPPLTSTTTTTTTSTTTDTAHTSAACSFDAKHETPQSCSQYSQDSHMDQADLPVDTFLNWNQEQFYPTQQQGLSLIPDLSQLQNISCNKNMKKRSLSARRQDYGRFRCNQCGKTFTAKCRLITHQSVHTGVKPYSCDKCGKWFSRTDSLTRHQKKTGACCPGRS